MTGFAGKNRQKTLKYNGKNSRVKNSDTKKTTYFIFVKSKLQVDSRGPDHSISA